MFEKHAITRMKGCSAKKKINKTKGKRYIKMDRDRVSELPDDILSSIISYFTVKDVANAGLLSSRWRHLCASLSKLDFQLSSMFRKHRDRNIDLSRSMDICRQYKEKFVSGVNQFLQGYQGTQLSSFSVKFCLEQDSTCDVDRWVSFAIRMGVEHLTLHLVCIKCFKHDTRSDARDLYTLRSELLVQCNTTKLQHLHLCSCYLGPGVINQFSSLKTIDLAYVPLGEPAFESIGSCCLTLESLLLKYSTVPSKLCISASFKRLKFLGVYKCWRLEMIKLSATNLTNFEYNGNLITFSFSGSPNVKRSYFRFTDKKGAQYAFGQLAKDLPVVETVLVYLATSWVKFFPEDITTFSKVKELEFFSPRQSYCDILKIFAILKACPLLENVYLVMGKIYSQHEMQQLCIPDKSVHKYLKEVHIGGFEFNTSYIDLVMYMLEYTVALERIIIDPRTPMYLGARNWRPLKRKTWKQGEREKVCSRLRGHSKRSMIIIL